MKAFLKVPPLAFLHLKTLVMIRSSTAVAERSTANTKTIHKEPTYHVFYVLRKVPFYLSYFVVCTPSTSSKLRIIMETRLFAF